MTTDPDMILRAEADRRTQEAVAAALMEAARLAFHPSEKLRAKLGSNIHVACSETNTKILALIPDADERTDR